MPLVQGYPVVFNLIICYTRKKDNLLTPPEKCWEPLYAICEVLIILIRMRTLVKNAHGALTS